MYLIEMDIFVMSEHFDDCVMSDDFDWSTFDEEEFKDWLINESPVFPEHVKYWLNAVSHKNAWKFGYTESYHSPKRMVMSRYDIMVGKCAWVSPVGEIIPVKYAYHNYVAVIILGKSQSEIEKTHVHLGKYDPGFVYCSQYVTRVTKKQKDSALKYVENNRDYFSNWIEEEEY